MYAWREGERKGGRKRAFPPILTTFLVYHTRTNKNRDINNDTQLLFTRKVSISPSSGLTHCLIDFLVSFLGCLVSAHTGVLLHTTDCTHTRFCSFLRAF